MTVHPSESNQTLVLFLNVVVLVVPISKMNRKITWTWLGITITPTHKQAQSAYDGVTTVILVQK